MKVFILNLLIFLISPSKFCVEEPVKINQKRNLSDDVEQFDMSLERLINLHSELPAFEYPDGKFYLT
jgi:hypothetical protein